jgi:gliding motility-associated-like protein
LNPPPPTPIVTPTATDIPCGKSTGVITVNVTGGTAPFNYSLNGASPVPNNIFSGLVAGNYRVNVKDAAGCSVEVNVTVKQIGSTLAVNPVSPDIPCGQRTGTIILNVSGGVPPFSYSLNGATPVTNNTFSGLATGSYKVTVKDGAGCSVDANVIIKQIGSNLAVNASAADVPCGQRSGKITMNVSRGTSPFLYSLNGATPISNNVFSNLSAGSYKVTVKDAAGCSVDASVTVKEIGCLPISESKVFVPTAFTPNKNSQNDYLQPYLLRISELTYFKVYNRWGQLVFLTTTMGKGWDGNISGIQQPGDTYTWTLVCIDIDGKVIRQNGRCLLIR